MSETDRQLVARIEAGDADAFQTLFRAYYRPLCAFAHGYLDSPADAEDAVQSVFLTIWAAFGELRVHTSARAYLYAAVRNHCLNRSARARLEQRWLEQAAAEIDPELPGPPAPDAVLELTELNARVQAGLDALPPGARRVLMLRWHDQLSYAEIAEALDISIKGVENQLARARAALRARLGDLID